MPEEFRVWKIAADHATKIHQTEPVSELSTKFHDKFSQKTMERLETISTSLIPFLMIS
jgi:hypothetical protein